MIGNLLGGRYELIEEIGRGGMATVYKAKCRLLNRYVAIKILKDEFARDQEFVTKFRMESQAAASLSHSNIVNIYDVGTDQYDNKTIHYIVMEYVKGQTLKDKLRKEGSFSPEKTIEYTREIGLALKEAHKNGIIHRDIKPQNIMVDQEDQIKVMDFGIARAATSSTIASTSEALGSVHYFSPEQARGGYTDAGSDIYSLGIVMYEMATGELPYKGESPITVALKHVQEDIIPPRQVNPRIPKSLETIILKCVEKKQVDRYKTIDELILELDRINLGPKNTDQELDLSEDSSSFTQVLPTEEIKREVRQMKKNKKTKNKDGLKGSVLGIIAALALVSLIFFGKNYLGSIFRAEEIIMPDLMLQSEDEAKKIAGELGIQYTVSRRPVEDEESGVVIEQDPAPGTKLKKDYPVVLVISENGGPVEVPDFLGQNIYQAETIARRLRIKLNANYVKSELAEAGIILDQSIRAGSQVEAGSIVEVSVAQGKEEASITMPKLLGLSLDQAKDELAKNNLKLGSAHEESSLEAKGTIIWQSYPTGQELNKNTVISVRISDGSGSKEEDREEDQKEKDKEEIKSQETAPKLNPVQLTINVAKEGTVIKVERIQNGETTTVYNQAVSAGDVRIGSEGVPGAVFNIYADGALIESVTK